MTGLAPITRAHAGLLDALLADASASDPHGASTAYHMLTGRNGLWALRQGASLLLLARHPNQADQLLAFPPLGPDGRDLLRLAALTIPTLRVCRVPHEALFSVRRSLGPTAAIVPEGVLDWLFPVHILGARRVAALEGPCLRAVRAKVRRASKRQIRWRRLVAEDIAAVLTLVRRWAHTQDQSLAPAAFEGPYRALFSMVNDPRLRVRGLAFEHNGRLVGFTSWEEPRRGCATACGLGSLARRSITGLAEFQIHITASHLADQGVSEYSLGGSETPGLDAFKRKFDPVRSVRLHTVAGRQPAVADDEGLAA